MNLWLSIIILTLLVALICFYPLLTKTPTKQTPSRDNLNKALYFSRLEEIKQDESQGLLSDVKQAQQELQQVLLEDIPVQPARAAVQTSRDGKIGFFISGFLALAIIGGLAYFSVGAWRAETMIERTYAKLPYFYERLKEEEVKPLSDAEMQQFSTALRVVLQKNPANPKGWWLLGQMAMNLDDPQLALNSYQQAYKLAPDNLEYKLAYARILMFSDDQTDKAKGSTLLCEVIRKDHTNTDALGLLAFSYFETEDYKMAVVTWAMMLRLLPKEDVRIPLIEKSIRAARDALAEQEKAKPQ